VNNDETSSAEMTIITIHFAGNECGVGKETRGGGLVGYNYVKLKICHYIYLSLK